MRQAKLSLLVITAILATSLPTHAQQISGEVQSTDLIGAGVSLIKNLLDPPSRKAEITADTELKKAKIAAEAEITKEKMRLEATKAADAEAKKEKSQIEASKNADKVTPLLTQWGVSRANCAPGLVFISGLGSDTVCIQPSPTMGAGAYTYDSAKQQLVRSGGSGSTASNTAVGSSSSNTNSSVTSEKNDGETIQKVQSTKISKDGQSVKTVQSTKVSRPSSSEEGF
jgi:hypothetical protein